VSEPASCPQPLRGAVIGLGVGEKLAEALASDARCELLAICDSDATKLADVAQRFPHAHAVSDADALLADPALDLVCIASYDNFHFAQTMRALEHDKHVFVEKPFVLHENEARAVHEQLRGRPHLQLSSNLILRRSPRFVDLRRRIDAGELGRLFCLEGDYNYGRLHKITQGWRGQLDFYSAVHGGGVHIADLLMWLARDRIVEVCAMGNAIASADAGFGNFDMVVSCLRFASGAVGKLGVNFGCVFPHFHNVSVYGTEATFVNGLDCGRLYTSRDPAASAAQIATEYPGAHKGALLESFVDAILGQGPAQVSAEDAFASLAVCFAIEQSAHSGTPVAVDYWWDRS
jgi:predicted dehydrogenase